MEHKLDCLSHMLFRYSYIVNGWMDGWMDGRTDVTLSPLLSYDLDGAQSRTFYLICCSGIFNGWMDGWMDGWVGGWVDGRTDGRTDGWMDERMLHYPPYCLMIWMEHKVGLSISYAVQVYLMAGWMHVFTA